MRLTRPGAFEPDDTPQTLENGHQICRSLKVNGFVQSVGDVVSRSGVKYVVCGFWRRGACSWRPLVVQIDNPLTSPLRVESASCLQRVTDGAILDQVKRACTVEQLWDRTFGLIKDKPLVCCRIALCADDVVLLDC